MPISFNNVYCTPRFQKMNKTVEKDPRKDEIRTKIKSNLTPKAVNPKYKAILDKFSDLDLLDEPLKDRPEDRSNGKYGHYQYQRQAQILVEDGIITPNTMVICDTPSCSIPILSGLFGVKNSEFKPNAAFNFSSNPLTGSRHDDNTNKTHFIDYAYTYGDEVNKYQSDLGDKANGLFLGLEGGKVDTSKLPSVKDLKNAGITKVVYLNHYNSSTKLSSKNTGYLEDYFKSLENDRMKVEYKGVSPRYQTFGEGPISL